MDKISPNQDLGGNSIEATKSIMDIQDKIAKLNRMIAQARDEVSRVNVAMKFFRNSSLQLKNPPNLQSLSTTTKVSFYFKTGNENGFLFYLGNEVGTNLRRTNSVSLYFTWKKIDLRLLLLTEVEFCRMILWPLRSKMVSQYLP